MAVLPQALTRSFDRGEKQRLALFYGGLVRRKNVLGTIATASAYLIEGVRAAQARPTGMGKPERGTHG